ncbi:MAG: helix-turn-helix transcriptional regulator [Oligoflexia bacterium]|nr:helix-turn-helix transcriptional regulator [Oligoflexia bacterium]
MKKNKKRQVAGRVSKVNLGDDDFEKKGRKREKEVVGLEFQLKTVRTKLGLNQSDLKGLTQPEVSKIERRKDLKISTLSKYAKAMGMSVKIFLTSDDNKQPRQIPVYG